jgi:hypothetical protein
MGLEDIENTRQATMIKPSGEKVYDSDDIIRSNERKWREEGKEFKFIYEETAEMLKYSNLEEQDVGQLIKIILELYTDTIEIDQKDSVVVGKIKENITNSVDTLRLLTKSADKKKLLCKLESFINQAV